MNTANEINIKSATPNGAGTATAWSREQAQARLSDYVEGSLAPSEEAAMAACLHAHPDLAREARDLRTLLHILHERIGPCEPSLDIWAELAPRVEQVMAEERLSLGEKVRLRSARFWNNVATGAILFTHALAVNTEARMRPYLQSDPFTLQGEEA